MMEIENVLVQWKEVWPLARKLWNPYVKLRDPQWCMTSAEAKKEGLTGSFAMIRLSDHRIVIDMEKVLKEEVSQFPMEVLAHEIGHHTYAPANLKDHAGLISRIRWGLPDIEDRSAFVANLYTDLLINDTLQRSKKLNMSGVYKQINKETSFSKVWILYMRTYEYLWKLPKGTLAGGKEPITNEINADASLAASLIRSYSKKWLDGAGRFSALLYPYLLDSNEFNEGKKALVRILDTEKAGDGGGLVPGLTELGMEEVLGAVDPRMEAIGGEISLHAEEALAGKNLKGGEGPKQRYLNPGLYIDLFKQVNPNVTDQELIMNYYREIALPYLVDFPVETSKPTSLSLPEGTENWDVSDPVGEIDWIESAITSPIIFPGYNTVKRVYGEDQSDNEEKKPLDVYIGIDCSGSMGNPSYTFSWPVLAATIIGMSALRAGAKVMGCLSGEPGSFMETKGFVDSDKDLLAVLTSYLGTGYAFGVPRLNTPFGKKANKRSHIILVTDDDLFSMLGATELKKDPSAESNWVIIERALKNAGGVGTLVLHSYPQWHREEIIRLKDMGWHIYYVTNEEELLTFASNFSKDHYQVKMN